MALDAQPRTHRDGARSCYFSDPDGNQVQIIHHPPIAERSEDLKVKSRLRVLRLTT